MEEREHRVPLVRHKKFRYITALTLGMDPAYLQTSLHARELYEQTPSGIAEKKAEEEARQREEQEKKAAIEREMNRRLEALKRIESPTF